MESLISTGLIGLSLGTQYALICIGFTLIFGIMGSSTSPTAASTSWAATSRGPALRAWGRAGKAWIGRISEAICELQRRGTTILMTQQMARPALKLVDRAYVIRGGEVRRSGTVDEIRDVALAEEYL